MKPRQPICPATGRVVLTGLMARGGGRPWAWSLVLSLLAFPGTAGTAWAQEADASGIGLEEIIVTARKREESIQETPISLTVMTGADMEARSLTDLSELDSFIPNVDISAGPTSGGSANSQITIRGIGQTDFLITTDPGVGTYVDGVYHARSMGGIMDLLDLERVEVLRGPQGTLFGKNTVGGAVNLISARPTGQTAGSAEVTLGRYDRLDARASFEFPIVSEKLFAKFALSSKNRDGYGRRIDAETGRLLSDPGDQNATSARGVLWWLASDAVTVDFSMDMTRERRNATVASLVEQNPNSLIGLYNAVGFLSGLYGPYSADVPDNPFVTNGTGPDVNDLDLWGTALTVTWESERLTLKSITAYRELDADFGIDADHTAIQYQEVLNRDSQDQFSQEFQLTGIGFNDRLDWIVGLYYFDENARDRNDVRLTSGLYDGLEALPGPIIPLGDPTDPLTPFIGGPGNPLNVLFDLDFDIFNEVDNTSYAAYLHGTLGLTERLSVSAGVRYTYEEKDYFLEHRRINSNTFIVPATRVSDDWDAFTPKGSIEFQATDDALLYASVARGFKSGGFNGRPTTQAEVESYDPEYVTSYEVGAKTEWFEQRLRLNVAGFYYDYEDLQLTIQTQTPDGNLIIITDNAGKAEIKGVEVELLAQPVAGLVIQGGLGYLDAKYTDTGSSTLITTDSRFVKAPKWSANASLEYAFSLPGGALLLARGDWSYRSRTYNDPENVASLTQDGYSLFNVRFSYESPGQDWVVSVFGTNLSDERYITNGNTALNSLGNVSAFWGRPREWGASVKKYF